MTEDVRGDNDFGSSSTNQRIRKTPIVFKSGQDTTAFESKNKLTLDNLEKAFPEKAKK